MTEAQLRTRYLDIARGYLGSTEGSARHHEIVDIYNTINPLPVGYKLQYDDDWCAGFVSAMAKLAGLTSIIFPECSCSRMAKLYDAVGGLKGPDYIPQAGDLILYDWAPQDNSCDHIGIVASVSGNSLKVLEGNQANNVEYRNTTLDWDRIWGYLVPDYASMAGSPTVAPVTGNRYLTQAEMETNATYIWYYLGARGWTLQAVAGMLGNMQTESTINPGIWEGLDTGDTAQGYGLVQWTPATKLIEWANGQGLDYAEMDTQLQRIEYELENGLQYYPTTAYPETFAQFKTSTKSPYYLGMAFLANYERPAVANQPKRGAQAEQWYTFLSALPAPGRPARKRRSMSLLLMYLATKRKV